MSKRLLLVISSIGVVVLVGATVVLAQEQPPEEQQEPRPDVGVAATGQANGGGCRLGFDTDNGTVALVSIGTVVNSVSITKPCPGVVVGQWTGEVETSGGGDIFLSMRATCTATGGLTDPCTVGTSFEAAPGLTFLELNTEASLHTHAMNAVWTGLKRGIWTFDVTLFGGGAAGSSAVRRTFTVEPFQAAA